MKILFWLSILTVIYVYFGYPLLVYALSLFYKNPRRGEYTYPTLSILISVYNEEKNIENKILSLLSIGYPSDRVEILIGSDGSTDQTDEIIRKFTGIASAAPSVEPRNDGGGETKCIRFFRQEERKGKPGMLNLLVKEAKGEIIVFSDARQRLDKDSLKELVKNFSDKRVGSVSAELEFEGENTQTGNGVGLYWKYEKFIRKAESKIGSMLGATGALYAIRKELFPELPKDLILDDVYIPMCIVQKGYRAIFDEKTKIYDKYSKSAKEEFSRKSRTLAGNFQLVMYLKWLLNPFRSPVAWQFISHKFLRLIVPFLLILAFVSNMFILENYFYRLVFILQIVFYTLAFFGLIFEHKNRLFDVSYMFCVMNSAAVVGLYKFLTHKQDVLWQKAGESLRRQGLKSEVIVEDIR